MSNLTTGNANWFSLANCPQFGPIPPPNFPVLPTPTPALAFNFDGKVVPLDDLVPSDKPTDAGPNRLDDTENDFEALAVQQQMLELVAQMADAQVHRFIHAILLFWIGHMFLRIEI